MAFTRVLGPGIHTASNINSHNINSTGIITAVSFVGDGSGLTGVASTDNIITGTAATFNTYPVDINAGMDVVGVSSFQDIDVDGHTNLDNVSIAGVTTHNEDVWFKGATSNRDAYWDKSANTLYFKDSAKIVMGDSSDFRIYHTYNTGAYGGANIIAGASGNHPIMIQTNLNGSGEVGISIYPNREVNLYYDNVKKLSTTGVGVTILGNTETQTLNVTGVSTFAGNVDINADIDVDGHTNLDNVSIAGVTTAFRIKLEDNRYIQIGNSSDLQLYHDGSHSYVNAYGGTGNLYVSGNSVRVQSNDNRLVNLSGTDIIKTDTTTAYLYHNGSVRMQTSSVGITVNNDLDVDGHTNLDNVSIAGVTTFSGGITGTTANFSGNVTVGGVLTYEDVKNVDSIGIATARAGLNVSG